jgi:hypothetical protein
MTVFGTFTGFTNTSFAEAIGPDAVPPYFNAPLVPGPYYIGFHVRSGGGKGPLDIDNIRFYENPTPPPKIAYGVPPQFITDPSIPIVLSGVYKKTGLLTNTYTVTNGTGKYGVPEGDMLWDVWTKTDWIKIIKSVPDPLTWLTTNPYTPPWMRQDQTFTIEVDVSTMTPGTLFGSIQLDAYLYNKDFPAGVHASNVPFIVPVQLTVTSTGGTGYPMSDDFEYSNLTAAGNPWVYKDHDGNTFATVWILNGSVNRMKITTYPAQLPKHLARYRYINHYWEIEAMGDVWLADIQFHYFDSEVLSGGVKDEDALRGLRIAPNTSYWEDPILGTWSTPISFDNYVIVHQMRQGNCGGQIALAHDWTLPNPKEPASEIPTAYSLEQNYPNPVGAGTGAMSTSIRFGLPEDSYVTVTVTNSLGAEVARLVNKELSAGYHTIAFDATNLQSGMYFYTLSTGAFTKTRTMILGK